MSQSKKSLEDWKSLADYQDMENGPDKLENCQRPDYLPAKMICVE